MCYVCKARAAAQEAQAAAVKQAVGVAQEEVKSATSGAAIQAKQQAGQDILTRDLLDAVTWSLGLGYNPHRKVVEQGHQLVRMQHQLDGLRRENERLAQQAHALNLQLNAREKELHEATLAATHSMNFAILLAKSVK